MDLDAIDVKYMEPRDRELLNAYHKEVYNKISPYLPEEEAKWLEKVTREI
ncbi:MAG: M24 family metallopeptidase C-terminal domain-containing protein [[Clostridium] symbiosum]